MGFDIVGDSIVYLHIGGIWARRGYPGRLMSHITDAVVAEVCAPMNKGVFACEDMAARVTEIWTKNGAQVTYGGHSFDGKSGLYQAKVYGYWPKATEEGTEET